MIDKTPSNAYDLEALAHVSIALIVHMVQIRERSSRPCWTPRDTGRGRGRAFRLGCGASLVPVRLTRFIARAVGGATTIERR
ncbi:MAG: hypothetical protein R3B99_10730 [Polyangiales bacterium]